ncbi:MAG: hypothetical protein ACSLFF_00505 [Solirubrobacterales bacterium]
MVTRSVRTAFLTVLLLAGCVSASGAAPALDTTFGGGVITPKVFPNGKSLQVARDAVIQTDGKVLVAMALSVKYGRRAERPVLRYNRDGTIDRSYGKNGAAWLGVPGQKYVGLTGIGIQTVGKAIVHGGMANTRTGLDAYFVARLTRSGKLDSSFGRSGVTRLSAGHSRAREILGTHSLADGRTIVAMNQSRENDHTLDLVRLKQNGRVDRGYGDRGIKSFDLAHGRLFPEFADIAIVGDEAFVLVNPDVETSRHPCKLIKIAITSNGGRVKRFGTNGGVAIAASKPADNVDCRRLAPTGDGGVAVVGSVSFNNFDGTSAGVVYKFRADGSRDSAFGVGGRFQGLDQDDFAGIAALPNGDYLIAGARDDPEGSPASLGGIALRLDASGGLHDLLAASTLPRTAKSHLSNFDHGPAGTVAVYSRYSNSGEVGARIAVFTN